MIIDDLFKVHVAKSHGFSKYDRGDAAFITNGFTNNGVQGYVCPIKMDKVFTFHGLCMSAFCEATVQNPPFVGRGNGGSGIIVLEPKNAMSMKDLYFLASYINNSARWRFSYGRMVSKERVPKIEIPDLSERSDDFDITLPLPNREKYEKISKKNIKYGELKISSIFNLHSGDYHNASSLPEGEIPLVSCGEKNNGVMRFVDVPDEKIYQNALTIAYNGQPMTTKYHPYQFAAKDDVAICISKRKLKLTTLAFIQFILNSEAWRFSFGRKCFREKLSYSIINLPIDADENIDEDVIEEIVTNSSYWNFLEEHYTNGIFLRKDII